MKNPVLFKIRLGSFVIPAAVLVNTINADAGIVTVEATGTLNYVYTKSIPSADPSSPEVSTPFAFDGRDFPSDAGIPISMIFIFDSNPRLNVDPAYPDFVGNYLGPTASMTVHFASGNQTWTALLGSQFFSVDYSTRDVVSFNSVYGDSSLGFSLYSYSSSTTFSGNSFNNLFPAINSFDPSQADNRIELYDNNGVSANGTLNSLRVSSVPEPSTYLAGLSALGMLGMFGWRNRK